MPQWNLEMGSSICFLLRSAGTAQTNKKSHEEQSYMLNHSTFLMVTLRWNEQNCAVVIITFDSDEDWALR